MIIIYIINNCLHIVYRFAPCPLFNTQNSFSQTTNQSVYYKNLSCTINEKNISIDKLVLKAILSREYDKQHPSSDVVKLKLMITSEY